MSQLKKNYDKYVQLCLQSKLSSILLVNMILVSSRDTVSSF